MFKGWKETDVHTVRYDIDMYPDFTEPDNFCNLINIQWKIFGSLGDQYTLISDENFQCNYLYNKIQGIKAMLSYGGSNVLQEYIEAIHNMPIKLDLINL